MPQNLPIIILSVAGAALVALALWIVFRRDNPRERERRSRLEVNARGRLADGNITEATDSSIFYSYSVGGVEYAMSQDIDELRATFKIAPERLIGCPVTVKYVMQNPANSIVVCEEWSGLHSGVR